MNSLEKEHAWQDHTAQLTSLLELHQTAIQATLHKHWKPGLVWYATLLTTLKSVVSNHDTLVQCSDATCFLAPATSSSWSLLKLKKTSECAPIKRCKLAGCKELAGDKCCNWYHFWCWFAACDPRELGCHSLGWGKSRCRLGQPRATAAWRWGTIWGKWYSEYRSSWERLPGCG